MPSEMISSELVTDDHTYRRSLHVVWGNPGGAPESPDGWVNAGFAQIQIREDHGQFGEMTGIMMGAEELDHLIRVARRVRRNLMRLPEEDDRYPGGPRHRSGCVDGSKCGDPHHCPPLD